MFNVLIHNKGADKTVRCAGWSATLLVSCTKVGVHTSTDVGQGKQILICSDHLKVLTVFIKMDGQFSVNELKGRKIHP